MGFYARYPANPAPVGGATAANQLTQIALETQIEANTGERGQQNMVNSFPVVIASDQSPVDVNITGGGGPITVDQGDPNTSANAWPIRITDGTDDAQVSAAGALIVDGSAVIQPVSGPLTDVQLRATPVETNIRASGTALTQTSNALNVQIQNTSVPVRGNGVNGTSVSANTFLVSGDDAGTQRNIAVTAAGAVITSGTTTISGPVSVTQGTSPWIVNGSGFTQPISAAALPLPTGASTSANQTTEIAAINAFAGKTAAGFVPEKFDEADITYVGVTTDINTVTYKLLGSTVATLTMSYDGSNRLSTVVKT